MATSQSIINHQQPRYWQ